MRWGGWCAEGGEMTGLTAFLDVTVLSVLQGIAEFLPISSSGHLVIGQHMLGLEVPGMRLDLMLHLGTLAPHVHRRCPYRDALPAEGLA